MQGAGFVGAEVISIIHEFSLNFLNKKFRLSVRLKSLTGNGISSITQSNTVEHILTGAALVTS
jgi:hypothetical protein